MFESAEARQVFAAERDSLERISYEELRERYLDEEHAREITGPSGKKYVWEVLAYWDNKQEGALRVFVTLTEDYWWRFSGSLHGDFIKERS